MCKSCKDNNNHQSSNNDVTNVTTDSMNEYFSSNMFNVHSTEMSIMNQFTNMNHPTNISQVNEPVQISDSGTPLLMSQTNPSIQIPQVKNSTQIPCINNLHNYNDNNANTSTSRNVDPSLMNAAMSNPVVNSTNAILNPNMHNEYQFWLKMKQLIKSELDNFNMTMDKKIEKKVVENIQLIQNKVKLLEEELQQKDEKKQPLIVVNQQRSLALIDSKERNTNLIISGLTEKYLTMDEVIYSTEKDKINKLFSSIGFNEHGLQLCTYWKK